jgi:hypothetical protein
LSRCGVCGRTLTDPNSISRGIGPVCWKKIKDNREAIARVNKRRIKALKATLEQDILNFLRNQRNVKLAGTKINYLTKRQNYWRAKGYVNTNGNYNGVVYDYSKYPDLIKKIQENPNDQFLALCYDHVDFSKEHKGFKTQMKIALMVKRLSP